MLARNILRLLMVLPIVMSVIYTPAKDDTSPDDLVWVERASMPTPRSGVGITAANSGKIYAIGGQGSQGPSQKLATVEEYDPVTDRWQAKASMPTARWSLAVVTSTNGKIYALGGYNDRWLATVEEYDPATDTWRSRADMPTGRIGLGAAAASNGKIYAIGGLGGEETVEEYDPATDSWQTKANMPTPRRFLAVVTSTTGKIYAIGGNPTAGSGKNVVEEYDPVTDSWRSRASMPTGRDALAVVAGSNGKIYAIGGGGALPTVEEYDPATDTWRSLAGMPTPRHNLGAAEVNGKIYAIGGYNTGFLAAVEETTITAVSGSKPVADLSVTERASVDTVTWGDTLTYRVTVTNNGPNDASNITIEDTLPDQFIYNSLIFGQGDCPTTPSGDTPGGTIQCTLTSLASGASVTIVIDGSPLNGSGTLINNATVSANEPDPATANNTATVSTTLVPYGSPTPSQVTRTPPYDTCAAKSSHSKSLPPNSKEIISKGFSTASSTCDPLRGTLNYSVVVFGGKEGNIFKSPSQKADASADVEFIYTPTFTGNLRIDANLSVNGKIGAAAGSDTALVDFVDVARTFLLPNIIDTFLDIATAWIFQTLASVQTEAFISVNQTTTATTVVGGHAFGASFPMPA